MVSNPMQRKSRNSFLLGVIITLLIAGVIIALLFLQLKQKTDELNAELSAKKTIYVLTQDVKSGQVLTQDMFQPKKIHKDSIPSNATSVASVIDTWFLQTKEGEMLFTDKHGLYLDRTTDNNNGIIEVITNNNAAFEDINGNTIENGAFFTFVNGEAKKINSSEKNLQQDQYGAFFIDSNNQDTKTRVWVEDATGEYYIYKLENTSMNTGENKTRVKEYIEIKDVPVIAKVAMNANTVITPNLVVQSDEIITDDVRKQEYNMVIMPIDLMTDDYVDVRLMLPSGQDFIVISKIKVEIPTNEDGTYVADTMRINLREDEILAMSSAVVEAYGIQGAKLYATKYVEAGMQNASIPTYTPNSAVTAQIQANPNIIELAKQELASRYSETSKNIRNQHLQSLIDSSVDYNQNIKTEAEQKITNSISARKKYLESLSH